MEAALASSTDATMDTEVTKQWKVESNECEICVTLCGERNVDEEKYASGR